MNNKFTLIFTIIVFSFLLSCEKETTRIADFFVEFATVKLDDSAIRFILDDGAALSPKTVNKLNLAEGDRVILNYTPLEDEYITINSVRKIFVDSVKTEGYPDKVITSPIKIVSIWVSGHYLNMSFEVDYHSKPHTTALFRDPNAERPTLHFSYSREDDPLGAPTQTYLSFDLSSLENETHFIVYVNTDKGMQMHELQLD